MAIGTAQQVNIDAVLATIRQMESGGNYTIVTKGGSDACGAYQYVTSTWQAMLYRTIKAGWLPQNTPLYSRACQAPPNVQDTVARYDVTTFLGSVGNNVSMVPIHWYYPAAIASWPAMASYVPPGNNISLGAYQNKWMSVYQSKAGGGSGGGNGPSNQGNAQVNNNTGIKYTYAQLEQVWINAGGNPQVAPVAAAVAMAESGGNPNAVSPSNDYGLWQINSIHGAQATLDVMSNARAAVAISNNGQNWGPWCTCWVNPQANCGHFLGPQPQPGSPAARFINTSVQPDPSAPTNGTAVATGQNIPQAAQDLSWYDPSIAGCNAVEWFIQPGQCAGGAAAGAVGGAASDIASGIINMIMASILNPLISLIAGAFGMLAGGIIMLIALWMMIKDTKAGKGIINIGIGAAGPEAQQFAMPKTKEQQQAAGKKMRTMVSTKRGQQKQKREALRNQSRRYEKGGSSAGDSAAGAAEGAAEAGAAAV